MFTGSKHPKHIQFHSVNKTTGCRELMSELQAAKRQTAIAMQQASGAIVSEQQIAGLQLRLANAQESLRRRNLEGHDEAEAMEQRIKSAVSALDSTSLNFELRVSTLQKHAIVFTHSYTFT